MKLIRFLRHELASDAASWVKKGIVTEHQAEQILGLYGTSLRAGQGRSIGYYMLLSLAALFVGLAVILLVSANWSEIPRAVRMGSLVLLTLTTNLAGIRCYSKGKIHPARLLLFLGSLFYGASVFLIAQIYHLGEHFPDGVFYWIVGILPLAFLVQSILLMLLATVLALTWLSMEGSLGFLPVFYPLFAAAGLFFAFRVRESVLVFLLTIVGCVFYGELLTSRLTSKSYLLFDFQTEHLFFTAGAFLILYTLGKCIEGFVDSPAIRNYGAALRLWSMRFGLILMLILSFEQPWSQLLRRAPSAAGFALSWSILVAIAVGAGSYLLARPVREESELAPDATTRLLSGVIYTCFFVAVALFVNSPYARVDSWAASSIPTVFQLCTNLLILASGIWLIVRGHERASSTYFYSGVLLLLITALFRYFDLIGEYVGGAIVFLVASAALFLAARYWRSSLAGQQEVQ